MIPRIFDVYIKSKSLVSHTSLRTITGKSYIRGFWSFYSEATRLETSNALHAFAIIE